MPAEYNPYPEIPSNFTKLIETRLKISPTIWPEKNYLMLRYNVPSLTRTQGFTNKNNPEIVLIMRDSAPPSSEFLSMNPAEIPWQKWNRNLWFYSDSDAIHDSFSRYFTFCLGLIADYRIDKGFRAPYFGLLPIFHSVGRPFPDIIEHHMQNGEHIFSKKEKLVKGEKLLERALTSFNFLMDMSPRIPVIT